MMTTTPTMREGEGQGFAQSPYFVQDFLLVLLKQRYEVLKLHYTYFKGSPMMDPEQHPKMAPGVSL